MLIHYENIVDVEEIMPKSKAKRTTTQLANKSERNIPNEHLDANQNEELKVSKKMLVATWAGVIVAILTFLTGLFFFWMSQKNEVLAITGIKRVTIAPTSFKAFVDPTRPVGDQETGILSAYWLLFLSNNGDKDISIISYHISGVPHNEFKMVDYSGMDQGLFREGQQPLTLPLTIPSGSSIPIYVKIGTIMDASAYQKILSKYGDNKTYDLKELETFLMKENHTDIYGNDVTELAPGIWEFPELGKAKEQIFSITFETARRTKVTDLLSWYLYSGMATSEK